MPINILATRVHIEPPSSRIIILCNTSIRLLSGFLLFKNVPLLKQEHNCSLIPIIRADNSRKIQTNKESRQLMPIEYSNSGRQAEVPTVLFRLGSLILKKPPDTLITIASNKAIKVKARLHTLNKLLKLPTEGISDCSLGT